MTNHLAAVRTELAELRDRTATRGGTTRAGLDLALGLVGQATIGAKVEDVVGFEGPVYLDEIVQRDRDVIDQIVAILVVLGWTQGTVAQIAAVLIDAGYATTVDGRFVRVEP